MEWAQTIVILVSIGGAYLHLSSKIDAVRMDLSKEIQSLRMDLSKEIQKCREDILWIKFQHGYVPEGMKEKMKNEETKKEAK